MLYFIGCNAIFFRCFCITVFLIFGDYQLDNRPSISRIRSVLFLGARQATDCNTGGLKKICSRVVQSYLNIVYFWVIPYEFAQFLNKYSKLYLLSLSVKQFFWSLKKNLRKTKILVLRY